MASMCSTTQSPRAEKAFSRAWAARTCPAPEEAESSNTRGLLCINEMVLFGDANSSGGGRSGQELVAFNFRGHAEVAIRGGGLDAHDLTVAADVHIAGFGNALRQAEDKFDFGADFEGAFGEKIKAAIAHVARVRWQFARVGIARKNAHRKTHGETPRFATVRAIGHPNPPARG